MHCEAARCILFAKIRNPAPKGKFVLPEKYLCPIACWREVLLHAAKIMTAGKTLLTRERFALTIERLCHQLLEDWGDFADACMIGIQPRGTMVAAPYSRPFDANYWTTKKWNSANWTSLFTAMISGMADGPLAPHPNEIRFIVAGKKVLLVDDVLYTGRTISAALAALQHYGRPQAVELLVLVDRRFNRQLPIQADYTGISVDAVDEAYVKVRWQEIHGEDEILLFANKP